MADLDKFICVTCSGDFNGLDISKHLTSTRHKSVKSVMNDEIIECEECEDSNIHQLAISRYGLSELSLLCKPCFDKDSSDDKPTTQYSLSNGAFFSKINQYFKFRDIECCECKSDSHLYVGNKSKTEKIIVCYKCLPKFPKSIAFTSEKDDKFLYELLGIKDADMSKKTTGRGRKVGLKGGKSSKYSKGPKKFDPEAEARKAHYMATKQNSAAIKSGSTVKAIGTSISVGKKDNKFSKNGPSLKLGTPKSSRTPTPKTGPSRQSTPKPSNGNSKSSTPRSSLNNSKASTPRSSLNNSKTSTPRSHSPVNPKPIGKFSTGLETPNPTEKPSTRPVSAMRSDASKPQKATTETPIKTFKKGLGPKSNESKGDKFPKRELGTRTPKPASTTKNANKAKVEVERVSNGSAKGKLNQNDKSNIKLDKKGKAANPKDSKKNLPQPIKPQTNSSKDSETLNNSDILGFAKYEASMKPKLQYDSLDSYYREMSFNMFLEEQLTNDNYVLDSNDVLLEWYQDNDKKNTQYKVSLPLKDEAMDRLLSQKMKAVKKNPFAMGHSMFLIFNDEIPWYGEIATLDQVRNGRKGSGTEFTEMIIQLYSWNNKPLPKTVNVQHLKILPASIPVSRVFLAMSRLSNPSFVKMLLGKEPIKQIVFRNYLRFTKDTFNESQKVAVQSVMNNAITVLQGPPGTGKTSTIHEIVLQLLDSLNTYPILVVAASNIAIDNIAEKLLPTHGKNILRITASEKEREYDRNHPLASICLHHKIYNALPLKYQMLADEMKRGAPKISPTAYKNYMSELFTVTRSFVAQARVIFTTTVVAGGSQMKSIPRCPVVIMDESTQSSEPTTLIPLAMKGVEKFVFVGDQRQLSCFSLVPNLSLSLFERVLLNGTYKNPHMLDTQYRMHPKISEFPRNRFYDGLLKDGITDNDRALEQIPQDPVYFWDTCGKAREQSVRNRLREDHGYTYINRPEIDYVAQVLKTLIYDKNIKKANIGVITPYSGQRDLISSTLVKDDLINPEHGQVKIEMDIDDIHNDSKPVTIHMVSEIMIASIDAFQGREKDFLVMSCVRSNENGVIGFLKDERRLNVALTRAKYGLIIIGDANCLSSKDPLWNEYVKYLQEKNWIHIVDEFKY